MKRTYITGYKYFTPRDVDSIPLRDCFGYAGGIWSNCPKCGASLFTSEKDFTCDDCKKDYIISNGNVKS